jgi:hypothetical protein
MHPLRRILAAFVVAAAASACSTPGSVKPGANEDAVRAAAGRPTGVIKLPDGGTRWQYSGQPFDQSVWNIDFDPAGRVVRTQQMMTDTAFATIRPGKDTQADVLRDFGPPAERYSYPLVNETAFMYRYFVQGGFHAAMFVYFDRVGVVKRIETGMDPYRITDGGDRR